MDFQLLLISKVPISKVTKFYFWPSFNFILSEANLPFYYIFQLQWKNLRARKHFSLEGCLWKAYLRTPQSVFQIYIIYFSEIIYETLFHFKYFVVPHLSSLCPGLSTNYRTFSTIRNNSYCMVRDLATDNKTVNIKDKNKKIKIIFWLRKLIIQ